jgi:hypothetical protein
MCTGVDAQLPFKLAEAMFVCELKCERNDLVNIVLGFGLEMGRVWVSARVKDVVRVGVLAFGV